jgi:hypothetical protein
MIHHMPLLEQILGKGNPVAPTATDDQVVTLCDRKIACDQGSRGLIKLMLFIAWPLPEDLLAMLHVGLPKDEIMSVP